MTFTPLSTKKLTKCKIGVVKYAIRLPSGITIDAEDLDSLLDVLASLDKAALGATVVKESADGRYGGVEARRSSTPEQFCLFLEAIKSAGNVGIEAKEAALTAGLKSGRALGGSLVTWSAILEAHSMSMDDVAINYRDGRVRCWRPGPKIEEGLAAVRRTIESGKELGE